MIKNLLLLVITTLSSARSEFALAAAHKNSSPAKLASVSIGDGYLESSATTTRKIGMYFQLELYRSAQFNQPILNKISSFDAKLRQCYTQSLRDNASLRGTIVFKILISERSGNMQQVRRSGGTLTGGEVSECLVRELKQIPLQVKRNMAGELKVTFEVS